MSMGPVRRAFSLIELLVVILILAILLGVAVAVPWREERGALVSSSADELAAVLRTTRTLAMEKRALYAVVFNIQNAPGTSGLVLNNRSGGHWYRVLGPTSDGAGGWWFLGNGFPPLYNRELSSLNGADTQNHPTTESPVRHLLEAVERAWVGDRHVLPPGKVRFVALTDQDNGNFRKNGDTYPPTYPRPWFGSWDPVTKRLSPWGGYDPALAMTAQTGDTSWKQKPRIRGGRTISHSGFFYEGYDGPITGCVNPSDRLIVDDTNNDGKIVNDGSDDFTKRYPLWRAGQPRPLINGQWQDFMIVFRPDGTVFTDWMRLRHECAKAYDPWANANLFYDPSLDTTNGDALPAAGKYHVMELGPADLCNRLDQAEGYPGIMATTGAEGSSFASRSGFYFITLGPDMAKDTDLFPDAQAVLHALAPLYRVGVSPFGEVVVRRVHTVNRQGRTFDPALTGADWNNKAKTDLYYRGHLLVDPPTSTKPGYTPRGDPITDVVTTDMLSGRKWWWQ
jgi:prepilin-type N-terminal cleavage/methylation domain-containing protein